MKDGHINCPKCKTSIIHGISFCPHCGAKLPKVLSEDEIKKNAYQILNVPEDANQETIKTAYKNLARKYHPDIDPAPQSSDRMKEVNWAYELLSDPVKRAYYDDIRKRDAQASPQTTQRPVNRSNSKTEATNRPSANARQEKAQPNQKRAAAVLGILLLIFLYYASVRGASENNIAVSYRSSYSNSSTSPPTAKAIKPTVTKTKVTRPTATEKPKPTSTPSCLHWEVVSDIHKGKQLCVYGRLVKIQSTDVYAQILRFSDEAGTFLLRGRNMGFTVERGRCVAALGVVQRDGNYLFMEIETTKLARFNGCD